MKKQGSLFSHTVTLGIAAAVSKAAVFFLMPFYTAYLAPADFGTADILVDTAILLLPFVSLNAPEAVFRFLAGKEAYEKKIVISSGVIFLAVGAFLLLLLLPLSRLFLVLHTYLPYLVAYIVASVSRSFLAHIVRAEGRYGLYAAQQVSCALLTVLLQILLLASFHFGVGGYLLGVIVADAAVALALLFFVRPWRFFSLRAIKGERLRAMLGYALPLIPTAALWWVTSISDRYIILHYHGSTAIGLYAAAARIPAVLTFAVGIFLEAWQYTAIREKEEGRAALFERIYDMLLPVSVGASALILTLAFLLVSVIYAPEYEGAVALIPFLTLASLLSALSSFLGSVYAVKLKSVASFLTAFCGAALNLGLNFLLIPTYGAIGAAFATFVAYFAVFAIRLWHSGRYLAFSHHFGKLLLSLGFLLLAAYAVIKQAFDIVLLPAILAPLPFGKELWAGVVFFCQRLMLFWKKRQNSTNRY